MSSYFSLVAISTLAPALLVGKATAVEVPPDASRYLVEDSDSNSIDTSSTESNEWSEGGLKIAQTDSELFLDEIETSPEIQEIDRGFIPDLPVGTEEDEEADAREQDNDQQLADQLQRLLDDTLEPEEKQTVLQEVMLRSLEGSGLRYPWLIDPTDNVGVGARDFRPFSSEQYGAIDFEWDGEKFRLDELTIGSFDKENQFYWILPNNRIVFETQGWLGGIRYQGETEDIRETSNFIQSIDLWGLQAAYNIPQVLADGEGDVSLEDLLNSSIFSCAAELESEVFSADNLNINLGCNLPGDSAQIINTETIVSIGNTGLPNTGETSTNPGGQNLFAGLEDGRTPLILQSWPTSDLRGLLNDGASLEEGSVLSESALASAGITFSDLNANGGNIPTYAPNLTSRPGLKFARPDSFDNLDLLSVLVDPSLQGEDFDNSYLNSLYWFAFPDGADEDPTSVRREIESRPWYQLYVSRPHNRAAITYNAEEISATFSGIFANPGLALNFSGWGSEIDDTQSLNASLGYLLGGIFEAVDYDSVQDSLDEAKALRDEGEILSTLNTTATSEQRRTINQRLNQTLLYGNFNSDIKTTSGRLTFGSSLKENSSSLWQLRTGLLPRRVQLVTVPRTNFTAGEAFFSELDISDRDALLINYIGVPVPESRIPGNTVSTSETILVTPDGRQISFGPNVSSIPLSTDAFALAYDDITISRIDERETTLSIYEGILNLPTVELAKVGSSDDWFYSLNTGLWANLDNETAPGLDDDLLNSTEPTLGAYLKGYLSGVVQDVVTDEEGRVISIRDAGPTFRSRVDSNGEFFVSAGYQVGGQGTSFGWAIRPTVLYAADEETNGDFSNEFIALFNSQLGWREGFSLLNNIQLGEDFYIDLSAQQQVGNGFSLGAYVRNYDRELGGLQEREDAFSVGGILRYAPRSNARTFYESRIGGGENGFDFEFRSRFSF